MQIFGGGDEFLTKRDFSEAVDLLQGCSPQQKTYDISGNSGLWIHQHEDRT